MKKLLIGLAVLIVLVIAAAVARAPSFVAGRYLQRPPASSPGSRTPHGRDLRHRGAGVLLAVAEPGARSEQTSPFSNAPGAGSQGHGEAHQAAR